MQRRAAAPEAGNSTALDLQRFCSGGFYWKAVRERRVLLRMSRGIVLLLRIRWRYGSVMGKVLWRIERRVGMEARW